MQVRGRVTRDSDMLNFFDPDAGGSQTVAHGLSRKARTMLDAIKAFFFRRGAVIVEHGELDADPGSGQFLARAAGAAAAPLGRKSPEFDRSRSKWSRMVRLNWVVLAC